MSNLKQNFMQQRTQPQSTYEREMADPEFRAKFEIEYQQLALSEIMLQLMQEEKLSVRALAKAATVSPGVIQDIRSGNRKNITLLNLSKILKALGSRVAIQVGTQYVSLER